MDIRCLSPSITWNHSQISPTGTSSWTEAVVDLNDFVGYSGWVAIYIASGGTTSGGTGFWIDDIRVENLAPYIGSLSPTRLLVGDTLTITGSGYGDTRGTSVVTFGGNVNPASGDYLSWGNNQITVKVPSGAKSGNVTITVGTLTSDGKNLRIILPPPTIDGGEQF